MNRNVEYLKRYLRSQTGELAMTYLAIIMAMTIVFSIVIYLIATSQFEHSLPVEFEYLDFLSRQQLEEVFVNRADQARNNLIFSLLFLNLVSFVCGSILSHILARRTLEPIEALMESQKQFVSDASHELRTPLTALQVTNEVALRKKKLTLDEAKELMGYNVLEVIKLRELTNSLLGLVKQESASQAKATFSIQAAITDVINQFASVLEEKDMTIENNVSDISLYANQAAVGQVMTILIDNAIKYSPNGSKITITSIEVGDELRVSVADQGIGIKKDEQGRVFDRFYRVDQSRSGNNVEGTGLGLSIAKAICERQGMRLTVKSTLNKGSTFVLHVKIKNYK